MKSFFVRMVIGMALWATGHGEMTQAQAALVTQFDVDGGNEGFDFGGLGGVDGAFDQDGVLVLGQLQPLPRVFLPVAEGTGLWRRSNQDKFHLLEAEGFAEHGPPFLQSVAFSFHGRAPVLPLPPGPSAMILFASGLLSLVGVVISRQGPLKRQDLGSGSDAPQTELMRSNVVFFVSPDQAFAAGVEEQLQGSGYHSQSAVSVAELLEVVQQRPPALVLVDRRISDWDMLRTDKGLSSVPIITMVPFDKSLGDEDIITDLERGADGVYSGRDGHKLFLAVIGAYFRRSGYSCARRGVYRVGSVELDADVHEVRIGGQRVPLSAKPFALLEAFMRAPSKVYSRSELLDLVWGPNFAIGDHTLDVHIHALRQLLDRDPDHACRLIAIKGVGFKLKLLQPSIQAVVRTRELPKTSVSLPVRHSSAAQVPIAQGVSTRLPIRNRRASLRRVSRRRRAQAFPGTAIVRHLDSSTLVSREA